MCCRMCLSCGCALVLCGEFLMCFMALCNKWKIKVSLWYFLLHCLTSLYNISRRVLFEMYETEAITVNVFICCSHRCIDPPAKQHGCHKCHKHGGYCWRTLTLAWWCRKIPLYKLIKYVIIYILGDKFMIMNLDFFYLCIYDSFFYS